MDVLLSLRACNSYRMAGRVLPSLDEDSLDAITLASLLRLLATVITIHEATMHPFLFGRTGW